jgi:hypothetical protein
MASRWRLPDLICFSSPQITQSMNARAGTNGISMKARSESTMTVPMIPHPKGTPIGCRACFGTEDSTSPLETAARNNGAVNL